MGWRIVDNLDGGRPRSAGRGQPAGRLRAKKGSGSVLAQYLGTGPGLGRLALQTLNALGLVDAPTAGAAEV